MKPFLVAALAFASTTALVTAQTQTIVWGEQIGDSAWSAETFVEVKAGRSHTLARAFDGTTRVWESTTGTGGWVAISPNLTKGTLGNRSYINQLSYAVTLSTTAVVDTTAVIG